MDDDDIRRELLKDPRFAKKLEEARSIPQADWPRKPDIPPNPPPTIGERLMGARQSVINATQRALAKLLPEQTENQKLVNEAKIANAQNYVAQKVTPVDFYLRNHDRGYDWARHQQEASQGNELADVPVDLGDVDEPGFTQGNSESIKLAGEGVPGKVLKAIKNLRK